MNTYLVIETGERTPTGISYKSARVEAVGNGTNIVHLCKDAITVSAYTRKKDAEKRVQYLLSLYYSNEVGFAQAFLNDKEQE